MREREEMSKGEGGRGGMEGSEDDGDIIPTDLLRLILDYLKDGARVDQATTPTLVLNNLPHLLGQYLPSLSLRATHTCCQNADINDPCLRVSGGLLQSLSVQPAHGRSAVDGGCTQIGN